MILEALYAYYKAMRLSHCVLLVVMDGYVMATLNFPYSFFPFFFETDIDVRSGFASVDS